MDLEWDEGKRQKTLRERGIDFADARLMDLPTSHTVRDGRSDYGEERLITFGFINERLHVICWTPRDERRRIISMRKANDREKAFYTHVTGPSSSPH
jgi:uncharacterized protein